MRRGWLVAVGLLCLAAAPPGYEEFKQKDGVTVYKRKDSPIIDLYSEGPLVGTPAEVRAVLLDYPRHVSFMRDMHEIRVISRGANEMVVYQRLKLPVIADRDMVLRVTWGNEGEVLWTHFQAIPGVVPPVDGVVRVTNHAGGWRLQPAAKGNTVGRYQMHIELGGSLPGWAARSQEGKDIPDLYATISKQVELRRLRSQAPARTQ